MLQTKLTLTRTVLILAWLTLLSACSSVPRIISEYRIDVQQGNVVTQEMVAQLRPGLTKDQVRFVLGTPMLLDPFHDDRWDYVFLLKKGNTGEVENSKLSVYFDKNGLLEQFVNDVTLKETTSPLAAQPAPKAKTPETTEQAVEAEEQTFEQQTAESPVATDETGPAETPTPTQESTATPEEDATTASQNDVEGTAGPVADTLDGDSPESGSESAIAADKPPETASSGTPKNDRSKIKVIDLGSIDESTYQPPPDQEEQGIWGRMMESIGF